MGFNGFGMSTKLHISVFQVSVQNKVTFFFLWSQRDLHSKKQYALEVSSGVICNVIYLMATGFSKIQLMQETVLLLLFDLEYHCFTLY